MNEQERAAAIEAEAQLTADNIECASQVRWASGSHRDDAVRNIRAGLERFAALSQPADVKQSDKAVEWYKLRKERDQLYNRLQDEIGLVDRWRDATGYPDPTTYKARQGDAGVENAQPVEMNDQEKAEHFNKFYGDVFPKMEVPSAVDWQAIIPATYYAGNPPHERLALLVADWRRLCELNAQLEARCDEYRISFESVGMNMHPAYVESYNYQKARADKAEIERDQLRSELESINALAREFGYGQGELDEDLAGCLRRSIDQLRTKVEQYKEIARSARHDSRQWQQFGVEAEDEVERLKTELAEIRSQGGEKRIAFVTPPGYFAPPQEQGRTAEQLSEAQAVCESKGLGEFPIHQPSEIPLDGPNSMVEDEPTQEQEINRLNTENGHLQADVTELLCKVEQLTTERDNWKKNYERDWEGRHDPTARIKYLEAELAGALKRTALAEEHLRLLL